MADGSKFITGADEFSVDAGAPLPEGYGDNHIVIMARDPLCFFAYWEITHERAEQIRVAHGRDSWDRSVMTLRVYDLGQSSQTPIEHAEFSDTDVDKFSRQWYVHVKNAGHMYITDLGLRFPDGKFVSLFRSNMIHQPYGRVSDQLDTQWISVSAGTLDTEKLSTEQTAWEDMAKIAVGAGTSKGGSGPGSEGATRHSLRWEFIRSVFSGSVSSWRPEEPKR